jgi:hypothetical protein
VPGVIFWFERRACTERKKYSRHLNHSFGVVVNVDASDPVGLARHRARRMEESD